MSIVKKISSLLLLLLIIVGCGKKDKYAVENYFKKEENAEKIYPLLPYIAKLDLGVNYGNRFDPKNREYFETQLKDFKFSFERYFITTDSIHYFLIWKVAPSLYKKKIAIGGRFKKDKTGRIYAFEELFNTAKMPEEELKEKSFPLFDYMAENGNVDKYLGQYLLIEFPDANCVYDKKRSRWSFKDQLKVQDSLDRLKKEDSLSVK
jgi:hypothetical protein